MVVKILDYMNLQFEEINCIDIFEEVRAQVEASNPNIDTIIEYDIDIKLINKISISRTKSKLLVLIPINLKYESNLKVYTTKIVVRKYIYVTKENDEYISKIYIKYANVLHTESRHIDFYLILGAKKDILSRDNMGSVNRRSTRYRR